MLGVSDHAGLSVSRDSDTLDVAFRLHHNVGVLELKTFAAQYPAYAFPLSTLPQHPYG
jgi:hypothetical protein